LENLQSNSKLTLHQSMRREHLAAGVCHHSWKVSGKTMTKKREATERELDRAKQAVAARVAILKDKGVEDRLFKKDTIWRKLDAVARKIRKRVIAIGVIEDRERDMDERRAAITAAVDAE
jgi:hypothetical protein